ncbi:hypothetical protein AB3S75_039826 [Citrus x aurantiifolia]
MCNPLCQRSLHRMEASIQKVIVGMAPKFICSERPRKQEEFCTKLEQKHKALEEERSNFEVVQRWLFRLILRVCHVSLSPWKGWYT